MSENLIYRTYQEGDEHGILELFKECFGHDLTLPFWEWKNKLAPGGGPRAVVAQEPGGKVVAAYHFISLPAVIRERKGIMGQSADAMVHPKYRGRFSKKGVLVKTFTLLRDTYYKLGELAFLYGFSGRRHWVLGKRTGIYPTGREIPFFKKTPERQKLSCRLRYRFRVLENSRLSILDHLWKNNENLFKISALRNATYVKWRYLSHPKWCYSVYLLSTPLGKPLGWCALREKENETLLMDFVVPFTLFEVLLEKVEEIAFLTGSSTVSVAVPEETFWSKKLLSLGYKAESTGIYFLTIPEEEEKGEFFYTMGDMDIV